MGERTEAPTPRRLADARAEGQVARSPELNAAAAILVGAWLLQAAVPRLVEAIGSQMASAITAAPPAETTWAWLRQLAIEQSLKLLPGFAPLVLGLLLSGVAVTLAQTGFVWAGKRLGFDANRINPLSGMKRLFSAQGLVELAKALLKLLVVGWVAYSFLKGHIEELLWLGAGGLLPGLSAWAELASGLALRVGAAYLVLALADYAYQRWRHLQSLRMTREEVKEDLRRSEGDPFLRGRIRQQQRRIARQRMMANVPKADVVITNPTHLAVAIGYEAGKMNAPKVLAKGAHRVAERIVALAAASSIPVIQNVPLARAIYRTVEVEQEIPPDLYLAMAEVLAYVYGLRAKRGQPAAAAAGPAGRRLLSLPGRGPDAGGGQ